MKKSSIFVILVIIILVLIAAFASSSSNTIRNAMPASETVSRDIQEVCFQEVTGNQGSYSTTTITAKLHPDNSVTGELNFLPSDKDKMTGSFEGVWKASATATGLDVIHSYSAEGVNATATRMIVFNDSYAQIDWMENASAGVSDQRIPKVSCSEITE